jgi:hypothetical protein
MTICNIIFKKMDELSSSVSCSAILLLSSSSFEVSLSEILVTPNVLANVRNQIFVINKFIG